MTTTEVLQDNQQSHIADLAVAVINTGTMTDDDSAASNGTAVNVVVGQTGLFAYLESTTAGNADTIVEVGSGGPTLFINDNDTPGGVQLYFDEDAADADSKFLAVVPHAADMFVPLTDGSFLRIVHDASAAANGVAVYVDDDAASAHLKLLFVSPTDADATFTTDDMVSMQLGNAAGDVETTVNAVLSALESTGLFATS